MAKAIYKYSLDGLGATKLPKDYRILSVIEQFNEIALYCLVDVYETEMVEEKFVVIGTGWRMQDDYFDNKKFIGTVSTDGGQLIWHVFQEVV